MSSLVYRLEIQSVMCIWPDSEPTKYLYPPPPPNKNLGGGGLRHINTCCQIPLQVNFKKKTTFRVWCLYRVFGPCFQMCGRFLWNSASPGGPLAGRRGTGRCPFSSATLPPASRRAPPASQTTRWPRWLVLKGQWHKMFDFRFFRVSFSTGTCLSHYRSVCKDTHNKGLS